MRTPTESMSPQHEPLRRSAAWNRSRVGTKRPMPLQRSLVGGCNSHRRRLPPNSEAIAMRNNTRGSQPVPESKHCASLLSTVTTACYADATPFMRSTQCSRCFSGSTRRKSARRVLKIQAMSCEGRLFWS